jgi:hypothetical protein
VLAEWWPVKLAGAMIGIGLAFDVVVYHRLFPYQAAWTALPLGLVELVATMLVARELGIDAPRWFAISFFVASWLLAQVLGHAILPLAHLSYAEDGGELGRGGRALAVAAPVTCAAALGVAWATQPPIVRLAAGVHEGPLVIDSSQRLVGRPGAVVRGGIVVRSDDVTIRDVAVLGGEIGIEVRDSENVVLDGVRIAAATMDGISARQSSVTVRDCVVDVPHAPAQGIEISFAMGRPASTVENCVVRGGLEGIVSHMARVRFVDNIVSGTSLRAITVGEMSMGEVDRNEVHDALGVGIFCGDYSHCRIRDNDVRDIRVDSGSASRAGYAVVSHYGSHAWVSDTEGKTAAFINATLERS